MTRLAAILASFVLMGACGGKDKKPATTSTGTVTSEDAADMSDKGPIVGDDVKTTTPGDDGGGDGDVRVADGSGDDDDGAGGTTGDDDDGGGADDGTPPTPEIKLPNHDLSPDARRSTVKKYVAAARSALEANNSDKAIEQAKLALDADPASVDAVVIMAHAYYYKNLDDTAELLLGDVSKRDEAKNHAGVFYVYGLIYDRANKPANALVNYTKAVELDGNHVGALINLGVHYLRNKQYKSALSTYKHVVNDLDVKTATTWTNLGSAYRGRSADLDGGDRDQALKDAEAAYAKAQQLDQNYAPAYYNRAILYLDADPFPTSEGPMDNLMRLERAKTYLDKYRETPGSDRDLADDMTKLVNKKIKREQDARKKPKDGDDDW